MKPNAIRLSKWHLKSNTNEKAEIHLQFFYQYDLLIIKSFFQTTKKNNMLQFIRFWLRHSFLLLLYYIIVYYRLLYY